MFPGRFQPFHKGHLHVVNELLKEYDEIVILIGSAQEGFTCRNPFTAGERLEMIDKVLRSEGYKRDQYWLIPAPDIRMPLAWTTYVLGLIPRVDVVVTGNPHVKHIFEWIGFRVLEPKFYEPEKYSGTFIRKAICLDGRWEDLVPPIIVEYIREINGVDRVKRVCKNEYC